MREIRLGLFVLLLGAATGCSFMAPQRDLTQWYVLSPIAANGTTAASVASTSQLSLGLGPIGFPDYLKRPWFVTRVSSNRLKVSDEKRWSERLDQNFSSVLRQNLSHLLGTQNIAMYPWYANSRIDYQIEVQVDHFETTDQGQSELSAVWTIRNSDGVQLASGQSFANVPAQGSEDAPAALSQDLGQMSRQIAVRIRELNTRRTAKRRPSGSHSPS